MRKYGVAIGVAAAAVAACGAPPLSVVSQDGPVAAGAKYHLAAVSALAPQAVDASSQLSNGPASAAADGNMNTAWSDGGYRNASSWVRLRYATSVAIGSVAVRMPPSATGTSYDLQVSADGTTWTTALANQKNTTWNPEPKTLPAGTKGQYLRMVWHNSASAPVPHCQVYELTASGDAGTTPAGTPTPMPAATGTPGPTPTPAAPGTMTYPQAAKPGPGQVAGLVYNNGKPIAGITIQVGGKNLVTDANGRYLATGVNGSVQAYYYNPSDRNKIGYWRSKPVTANATTGATVPTVDLFLTGMLNTPPMDSHITLPYTFVWKPPMQQPVGYFWRIHDRPFTTFTLVYQSAKLPGTATSFTFSGAGVTLDPAHRYFWGVQWDWGPLGQGGNLYQAAYMTK